MISCTFSIVNQSVPKTKLLFIIHSIHLDVNTQTTNLPNVILSCIKYNRRLESNLSLKSNGKSLKSIFLLLLSYILLSNDHFIKLTFNLSTILLVKEHIGCPIKNIYLYSIGKLSNQHFIITAILYVIKRLFD